jgi:hypothetical protein
MIERSTFKIISYLVVGYDMISMARPGEMPGKFSINLPHFHGTGA